MTISEFSERLADEANPLRVHLIGVAGSGMSGLAGLLLEMGHQVSGSDRVQGAEVGHLNRLGLNFSSPHSAECVTDAEVVVYSSAIKEDNAALAAARKNGASCFLRAECLAAILSRKDGVVVCGTHGKTTTSAMTAHLLKKGKKHPSHYVGAEIPVLGANAHWDSKGELMVAEGDESDGTLTLYRPKHTILLNVEEEHLDHYSGLEEIKDVFRETISNTSGSLVFCKECPTATELAHAHDNAVSYGWNDADYVAKNIVAHGGRSIFDLIVRGEKVGRIELGIPGRHNVLNALGAIAIVDGAGVEFSDYARSLSTFAGAKRRFETKLLTPNYRIVDDYGHHPTEIEATLKTARSLEPKRLVVVFQPHRYSRTQRLAEDFGESLEAADVVYVTDVYAASEEPIPGVSGQTIVDAINARSPGKAISAPDIQNLHHEVGNDLQKGDLLMTLGAGNVHRAGSRIVEDLKLLIDLERETGVSTWKLYEPMRKHSTIRLGGPAQYWVQPETFTGFASVTEFFRQRSIPLRVVGRGSNLLVRDGGIRGAVIQPLKGEFASVTVEGDTVTAGVGAKFKKVASAAQRAGIGGFEWMEGIPGNVGGGLRMNAGAMGVETFDQVVSVKTIDEDGVLRERTRDEIVSHYRSVPSLQHNFALCATFRGVPAPQEAIDALMKESRNKRNTSQPKEASAGCIFKNPEGIGAGQLIDEMGLKGTKVGNAMISEIHGNFMTNMGGASAADVLGLIEMVSKAAKSERNIDLRTEVQIIGEESFNF